METELLVHHLLLLLSTSAAIAGLLEEPKVFVKKYIELGGGQMAECEVAIVHSSESLLMYMYFDGKKLHTAQSRNANTEVAQALITPEKTGNYVLSCSATVDEETKTATANILVYNFPEPGIKIEDNISDYNDDDESTLVITCELSTAGSRNVSINITVKNTPLTCNDNVTFKRTCTLPAKKEHDGKQVTCEARMSVLDAVMVKNKTVTLNIKHAPEFRDDHCPTNQTLTEGQLNMVLCKADGNPHPGVVCRKDGIEYTEGMLPQVTRNHSGEYQCKAFNERDAVLRAVTVRVKPRGSAVLDRSSFRTIVSVMALAGLVCNFF